MSTIPIDDKLVIGPDRANIDARYKASNNRPYASVAAAEAAINLVIGNVGLTVLVADENDPDYPKAKEYWVQPYDKNGVTAYHLVEKQPQIDTSGFATKTEVNAKQDALPSGNTGQMLKKTASGVEWDDMPSIEDGENTAVTLDGTIHVSAIDAENDENAGVEITPHTGGGVDMKFTLPKGADGQNGITPSIDSTTKQWMIGTTSTGVLAEGHNPNRGMYNVGDTFPSDGIVGDYIVVVDTTQSTPTAEIHKWDATLNNNAGGWAATGVAPSDAEFEDGELVVNTKIDDTQLATPLPNALAKAVDVSREINGNITETETEITLGSSNIDKYYNAHNYTVGGSYPISTSAGSSTGAAAKRATSIVAGKIYRYKGICDSDYYKILIVKPVEGSTNGIITRVFDGNYRTNPLDIVVQDEEAGGTIYFNFKTYDSSTDKLYQVTRSTSGGIKNDIDELDTRVTELEEGGMIDTTPTIVDDDTKVPTSKAVYEELNGNVTESEEEITPITVNKYYNTSSVTVGSVWNYGTSTLSGYACKSLDVVAGETYKIYGSAGGGAVCQYVILDSSEVVLYKKTGRIDSRETPTEVTIEQDGHLVVNLANYNSETDKIEKIKTTVAGGIKNSINALDTRVTELEGADKPLAGKTFLVFGDSLSQLGSTVTGENNKRWSDYFGEITGATVVNVAIGGARMAQNRVSGSIKTDPNATEYSNSMNIMSGLCVLNMVRAVCGLTFNESYTYMQLAQQFAQSATSASGAVGAVSRLAEVDITSIDGVIILAGSNDYQAGGDIEGTGVTSVQKAIELIVETLLTANPKLSIFWGTPLICYATDNAGSGGVYNDTYWSDSYIPRSITLPGMARIIITNLSGVITRLISWNNHLEPKTISILAEESGGNMYVSFLQPEVEDGLWKVEYGVGGVETKNKMTTTSGYYKASILVNNVEVVAKVGDTYSEKFVTSDSYSCIKVSSIQEGDIYQYVGVAKDSMTGEQVANFIFDKVRLQKIPIVDMYHEMGWTKTNFNQWFYDHIHPRKGLKQIARKMAAFVIANRNFD